MRVIWGSLLTDAAFKQLQWMTTVIGVICQYSMIYLPAYLSLCESAEALGSGVACYRLSRRSLLLTYLLLTSDLYSSYDKIPFW